MKMSPKQGVSYTTQASFPAGMAIAVVPAPSRSPPVYLFSVYTPSHYSNNRPFNSIHSCIIHLSSTHLHRHTSTHPSVIYLPFYHNSSTHSLTYPFIYPLIYLSTHPSLYHSSIYSPIHSCHPPIYLPFQPCHSPIHHNNDPPPHSLIHHLPILPLTHPPSIHSPTQPTTSPSIHLLTHPSIHSPTFLLTCLPSFHPFTISHLSS